MFFTNVVFTLIDALKDIESLELQLQNMIDGQKKDQNEQEIKQADEKGTVFIKSEKKIWNKEVSFYIMESYSSLIIALAYIREVIFSHTIVKESKSKLQIACFQIFRNFLKGNL